MAHSCRPKILPFNLNQNSSLELEGFTDEHYKLVMSLGALSSDSAIETAIDELSLNESVDSQVSTDLVKKKTQIVNLIQEQKKKFVQDHNVTADQTPLGTTCNQCTDTVSVGAGPDHAIVNALVDVGNVEAKFVEDGEGFENASSNNVLQPADFVSGGKFNIPTDRADFQSPLFTAEPFTQHVLRFEEFGERHLPANASQNFTDLPIPDIVTHHPPTEALDDFL